MNDRALIGIVNNIILLLALGVVYEIVPLERPRMGYPRQVLQGLVIGLLAVLVMLNPWEFSPGIIFDTRSVLLSIAGLFWGIVPATVAALVAALLRLVQGGAGAWTGVAVIVTSAALGAVWRLYRPGKSKPPGWGELYLFGLVVHMAMLLWMLTLPGGVAGPVLQTVGAPVLLFYPPATAVLGKLLARQAARRETDARYRLLVDLSPYAIGVHQDGRLVFANRAAARLLGAEHPDQLLGRSVQEIVHPDGLAEAIDRIQRMLKGETGLYPVEDRYVRLDGSVVDVEVTAAPFTFRGRPAVQVIALDISARKQAEQSVWRYARRLEVLRQIDRGILEARSSEQIVRSVLDHIRILIPCRRASVMLFDTAGGQCRAIGFVVDQETVVHENRLLPVDPTALPVWQNRQVDKVDDTSVEPVPDIPYLHRLLAEAEIRSYLVVPLLAGDDLLGTLNLLSREPHFFTPEYVEIAVDLAAQLAVALQQARLREAVERHAEELEQRIAERTARLAAANRELEAFAYSVSHDLKAPLRGIDGYSRLLLEEYADRLDDQGRHFLHTIRQAVYQMHQLIDDLLQYARLDRQPARISAVNLESLVSTVLAERRADLEGRGVEVRVSIPCPTVSADPDGLLLVLRNLLDNALKFTAGVPAPVIEIGGRESENSCIIWVKDNGVGFDMKFHDRIFEIFQRLHHPETYPGTGVGLAIVHKAVERMQGRVWAESQPGQGATFFVELPL